MNATSGHPVVINFSTTPAWMWKTDAVVDYPEDADEVFWDYNQGTALRDPTMKELAGYYARVFSWYTQGGFTDELGKFHKSNHFYKIPYWEVLNEPDLEHGISAEMYTKMYDAIVGEIKNISPSTKFIGIALGLNARPDYFEYFLNPKNHQPGIPLDGISYHFYASPSYVSQSLEEYQYTFFEQEKAFLEKVRFIESIRKRLSPSTITMVNEIGTIIQARSGNEIPKEYWNLSGALFADIYLKLMKRRIDVVGQSQLVGYPSMFPDVSMMDSTTGNPNARYWVLKLLKENFNPGDKLAATALENTSAVKYVVPTAQAFITATGRKILLVNKHNSEIRIALPADSKGKTVSYVDVETGENPPAQMQLTEAAIVLKPFAVAVVHMD